VLEGSPGELVTRKFLLDKVFGYNEGVKTRTLDVHADKAEFLGGNDSGVALGGPRNVEGGCGLP
jgi:hypothetical protein